MGWMTHYYIRNVRTNIKRNSIVSPSIYDRTNCAIVSLSDVKNLSAFTFYKRNTSSTFVVMDFQCYRSEQECLQSTKHFQSEPRMIFTYLIADSLCNDCPIDMAQSICVLITFAELYEA